MASDPPKKTVMLDDSGAALPVRGQPLSPTPQSSGQATMMLDASHAQPNAPVQRQMVVPQVMQRRPMGELPPVKPPKRESTAGRWIGGPIVALVVAVGTAALARAIMPYGGKKPQGHVRLQTDPEGASVVVDGHPWNHFTPTVIEGDLGSSVHLVFRLEGYEPKEADIYVTDGERPFSAKLTPLPQGAPPPEPVVHEPREHHHHVTVAAPPPPKVEGKGAVTIRVRPWAIVYVDGARLRQTPVTDYQMPAGKHVIELVNEGMNRREKINVTLKDGDTEAIERDWDR